ncbi:GntR family transcriptional regulator [Paenibacillus sp. PCH8]|uniref:GntR family transcriptional regulator n=1 Tax=Paenibacillus sp. PCH8 TaxID=2066524 RepID=UPI000CFA429B|nr:GntR family transcriptional regulator [Paenibacillus sp. PCH8]PQP84101.1 GntR family transcriptional regulator [Paenibacillus sp. PCH8]
MLFPSSWLQGASRGEAIACELRLRIISGSLRPGEILSENRIAADFDSSRSPVREALRTLSNEGLIRLERMGVVVLGLRIKDVEELYDVRFLIESFVQQRLAGDVPDSLITQLRNVIDKMHLAGRHQDAVEFAYQDLSFHETIIEAAQHSRISHLWNSIRYVVMTVMLLTTRRVFLQGEQKVSDVIEKHRSLVKALESGDLMLIQAGVRTYFQDSGKTLHESFDS